jgi:hypothetical protein
MNGMETAPGLDFDLADSIQVLKATPGMLTSWLSQLPERLTASAGDPENWEPHDIIGHLIHCDETDWVPRARVILEQGDDRKFPPFDPLGRFEKSRVETLPDLLEEFAAIRKTCLDEVSSWNLNEQHLGLTGIHPEFGEVTLRQLLATWVAHDQTHIRQIAVSIARKYAVAVGPWKVYLSILK